MLYSSHRLKAANAMSIAAQGYYTLADTALKAIKGQYATAYLLRVESGTGVAHSRQSQEREAYLSQANRLNAKEMVLNARGSGENNADSSQKLGHINIEHAELTSNDKEGQTPCR